MTKDNLMKLLQLSAIALIIATTSCNVAYRSSMVNTPLFTEKGDVAITAASNNVQAAYAVSNHVGIMANGFLEQNTVNNNETGNGGLGYMGEAGAGYFTTLGNENLVFETYAGAGFGHLYLNNNYRDGNNDIQKRTLDANGLKLFIQPGIGYKLPYFEVSGALRYSNVNYSGVRTTNWPAADLVNANLDDVGNTAFGFLEPALTIRGGFKSVKLQLQYINCIKLNSANINYDTDILNLGIIIQLPVKPD